MTEQAHQWSEPVEQAILGVLLDGRHKQAWEQAIQHVLHPAYFFGRNHALLWLVMTALADRGEAIDAMSVAAEAGRTVYRDAFESLRNLQSLDQTGKPLPRFWKLPPPPEEVSYEDSLLVALGGLNTITDLAQSLAPVSGLEANCRKVAEYHRLRKTIRLVSLTLQTLQSPKGVAEMERVANEVVDGMANLVRGSNQGRSMGECLTSAIGQAEQRSALRSRGQLTPVTWGIPQLDILCPLRPGRMYVLSAPPGSFKTSLALQCAAASAEIGGKGSVAISSMEVLGEDLAMKLVARELGIATQSIEDWTPAAASRKDEILRIAQEWHQSDSMMVRDNATTGTGDTATMVCNWLRTRKTISGGRLGLGIIDYLGLLVGKPNQRSFDVLEAATRTIKQATMALRLPIILLAQMNREGRKADRDKNGQVSQVPEPRLEDLKGAGSIEQDADAVIFLHFPNRKRHDVSSQGKIIVAKNRLGPTGEIEVTVHMRHQLIVYSGLPSGIDGPPLPEPRPSDLQMAGQPDDSEHLFGPV